MKRNGCAVQLLISLAYVIICVLTAFFIYRFGTLIIDPLIPDADAVEVAAPTTTHTTAPTTTGTKVVVPTTVDEKVAQAGAKLAQADANVEGTVENPAEPTPELPRPTIGEVDAEAEENRLIEEALLARAHKIEDCLITYYCCEKYPHICGTGDGLTALGGEVLPGVSCAVPPEIPLGSTIMIDWGDGEIEYRRADDRGDAVRGDHIDLAVPTHSEALDYGVDRATVYWCEE